jgi:hypothetical protein
MQTSVIPGILAGRRCCRQSMLCFSCSASASCAAACLSWRKIASHSAGATPGKPAGRRPGRYFPPHALRIAVEAKVSQSQLRCPLRGKLTWRHTQQNRASARANGRRPNRPSLSTGKLRSAVESGHRAETAVATMCLGKPVQLCPASPVHGQQAAGRAHGMFTIDPFGRLSAWLSVRVEDWAYSVSN